jgi:hypothetical protein
MFDPNVSVIAGVAGPILADTPGGLTSIARVGEAHSLLLGVECLLSRTTLPRQHPTSPSFRIVERTVAFEKWKRLNVS